MVSVLMKKDDELGWRLIGVYEEEESMPSVEGGLVFVLSNVTPSAFDPF